MREKFKVGLILGLCAGIIFLILAGIVRACS